MSAICCGWMAGRLAWFTCRYDQVKGQLSIIFDTSEEWWRKQAYFQALSMHRRCQEKFIETHWQQQPASKVLPFPWISWIRSKCRHGHVVWKDFAKSGSLCRLWAVYGQFSRLLSTQFKAMLLGSMQVPRALPKPFSWSRTIGSPWCLDAKSGWNVLL